MERGLSLENYKKQLERQLAIIQRLLKQNEKNLSKYKDIDGKNVKVSYSNGKSQYYYIDAVAKRYVYLPKSDIKTVKRIVQRDYELSLNKKLKEMEGRLSKFCKKYSFNDINIVYEKLPLARKELVLPIIEPDEQYIERWRLEHPGNQNQYPEDGRIITANGEKVRSKSEKIIADLFCKYEIPFIYEPSLIIGDNHVVNPDFAVLNVRKRKTIYWEHLGLIDMEQYAIKNFKKINDYNLAGYELGDDLILTMETSEQSFDSRDIENKIIKYCL